MRFDFKVSSKTFIILLGAYFAFMMNLSFWRFFFKNIEEHSLMNYVFLTTIIINVFLIYTLFFNLILWKKGWKVLSAFFLISAACANYFMYQFNIIIDKFMVRNVMETTYREASELVTGRYVFWVIITGVLPAVLVCFLKADFKPFKLELKQRLKFVIGALLFIGLTVGVFFERYKDFGQNNENVHRMFNLFNYTYSTYQYFHKLHGKVRPFRILDNTVAWEDFPNNDGNHTLIVVVVGETARAANYQLNGYPRETNPYLSARNDIIYFNKTTSCGTDTSHSLPCIFSADAREDYEQGAAKYEQNVVDMIQSAGYGVLWRENNEGCKGVCDRVPTELMVSLNHPDFCFGLYCHDEALLTGLEDKIKNMRARNNFLVLHLIGSHGPAYYKRYPKRFEKFTPACNTADIQDCTQEEIVNTYDNTLVYTDFILSQLIKILEKFPQKEIALLYVSDHGESLGEDGMYFHGYPYNEAPAEQKEVPMLMWFNKTALKYDHLDFTCIKNLAQKGGFSHDNIFHTLLGLTEVDSTLYNPKLDMFTPCRLKTLPAVLD